MTEQTQNTGASLEAPDTVEQFASLIREVSPEDLPDGTTPTQEEIEKNSAPIEEVIAQDQTEEIIHGGVLAYAIDHTARTLIEDVAHKLNALTDVVMQDRVTSRQEEAQTVSGSINILGFDFNVRILPKQDATVSGTNSLGRPGLVLEVNDGDRTYAVAKLEWDHTKQGFVLFAGKGVS